MSKLENARAFLRDRVERAMHVGETRLPRLVDMAAACGVSHVTMAKAVRELVAQGALVSAPGRGIRIARDILATETPTVSTVPRTPVWLKAAEEIRQRIIDGRYGRGTWLPSVKQLKEHHGVSSDTMLKALRRLSDEQVIEKHKRRYCVPRPRFSTSRDCVVLICRDRISLKSIATERHRALLRRWDSLLGRHGIELLTVPLWYEGEEMVSFEQWERRYVRAVERRAVLGFLYWNYAMAQYPILSFVRGLRTYGHPFGLLIDPVAGVPALRTHPGYPVRIFVSQHHYDAAKVVGQFCRATGASTVCYIEPPGNPWWSQERRRGLADGLTGPEPSPRLHVFAAGTRPGRVHRSSDVFRRALSALRDEYALKRGAELAAGGVGEEMCQHLTSAARVVKAASDMHGMVGHIAQLPTPMCIVGADDELTHYAYLLIRHVAPQLRAQCRFIGFNDSDIAFANGFSSYSFNDDAAAQATVQFLLEPHSPLFRTSHKGACVDIGGYLNVRSSQDNAASGGGSP